MPQSKSAHEQFNAARAALYPQLPLSGSVGPDAKGLENWFNLPSSLLWNVIGGLTQPVLNGRTLKTQKEIARLQEDATYLDVLSAQNSVLSSELALYSTYNTIIQQKIILYRALGGGWR